MHHGGGRTSNHVPLPRARHPLSMVSVGLPEDASATLVEFSMPEDVSDNLDETRPVSESCVSKLTYSGSAVLRRSSSTTRCCEVRHLWSLHCLHWHIPLLHQDQARSSKSVRRIFSFFDTSRKSIAEQARASGRASTRPQSATALRARSSPLRLSGVSSRCNHGHASHSRCSISASISALFRRRSLSLV